MDFYLLLYCFSNAYGSCTRALTSHLNFPTILPPLGVKLLTDHRASPPLSPCLLPSHLSVRKITTSVPKTKTQIKPNRRIPNHRRPTRHQVSTVLS